MDPLLADPTTMLVLIALSSIRTQVAMMLLPIYSSRVVPAIARNAFAFAIVVPVAASQLANPPQLPQDLLGLASLVFREAVLGGLVGLGIGAFLAGLQSVGELIDHQTGLTFTQNVDPMHGNSVSTTSVLIERVLFGALMAAGIMLLFIDALYLSYELWPVGAPLRGVDPRLALEVAGQASRLFALALLLAGPVVLALFVVDVSMGLLNRSAPQLNVFQLTLSLKSVVGLGVLAAALPLMIERTIFAVRDLIATLRDLLSATGG